MKLPILWLKKYIDPKVSAEALAEKLTLTGTKVEAVERALQEPVIEMEVTTNRPDCLSILGLAREVSAITGRTVKIPSAYSQKNNSRRGAIHRAPTSIAIKIEDKNACSYYTARVIEGVRVSPAPPDAVRLLDLMGTRPVSNVVDATNFVLFECGQPLHAFDADKIQGGQIAVRRARSGETLTGIDGNTYKLDPDTLVIADAARPIAMAGVIGGKETEVTAATRRVLLESAWFDPALVRRASKKYKISTESSYRFERRVNIENVAGASRRAAELITQWAAGKDVSGLIEAGKCVKSTGFVSLRIARLKNVLGLSVSAPRVLGIFKKLGLHSKSASGKVSVRKAAGREDLQIEADLIEEVLRIEGFDKIPTALPVTRYRPGVSQETDQRPRRLAALKHHLASAGLREILTYSLLSEKMLEHSGLMAADAPRLSNPASAEQEFLRPNLLPGVLSAVAFNAHRKASSLKFFEIGKRYSKTSLGPSDRFEETALAVALYGAFEENWKRKSEESLFDAKGAAVDALSFLGATVEFRPARPPVWFSSCAEIIEAGRVIGVLGAVSDTVRKNWDIPHALFVAEMSLENILDRASSVADLQAIPKYPSVRRDLAFILDRGVTVDRLEQDMRAAGSPYLQDVRLFDEYTGKNIPSGRRSLAFALSYQKETGTFTDSEIQRVQGKVVEVLKQNFGAEFR